MKPISSLLAAVLTVALTTLGFTNAWSGSQTNTVAESPAAQEMAPKVRLELRDGSRIVGNCLDDPIRFHSATLDDFKLPVVWIRSIEFKVDGQDDAGTFRLTTTNGDALDVQLVAPLLDVQTGFGKSELPVKMIRSIKISSANAADTSSLTNNLLSYWNFDGSNPNFYAANGGNPAYILRTGNDGRGMVNPGSVVPGKIGNAIKFGNSGNQGLFIPSGGFPILTTFTITAWVKLNSPQNQSNFILIACSWDGFDGWNFRMDIYNGRLDGNVGIGGRVMSDQNAVTDNHLVFNDGQWHFCVFQCQDNSLMRVKVDDNDWTTLPISGSLAGAQPIPFQIGQNIAQSMYNPNCSIDMLGVWTRTLSDSEIAKLYNQGDGLEYPFSGSMPAHAVPATVPSASTADSQLTLDLRDGSHVIGKCLDDPLKFHSASLGDFKLPVAAIKSIEFTGKGDGTENSARLSATNGDVLDVQLVASSLHVETSFGKSELPVTMIRSMKSLPTGMTDQPSAGLINVDFGSGGARGYSQKTGFAAIGQTPGDFWNFYDRDLSPNPTNWQRSGSLPNLKLASGGTTVVGMSVSDAAGAWNDDSSDPMYKTYDYPLDGGNNFVTFTHLPPGRYEVLAYSPDGNYELTVGGTIQTIQESPVISEKKSMHQSGFRQNDLRLDSLNMPMLRDEAVWADSPEPLADNHISPLEPAKLTILDETTGLGSGRALDWTFSTADRRAMLPRIGSGNNSLLMGGTSYGVRMTHNAPVSSVPVWTEGLQYARWRDVTVAPGQSLTLTVRRGTGDCAILSGIQILSEALVDSAMAANRSGG